MAKLDHSELRQNYLEDAAADEEIFAEQRSNILLVASDHYSKKSSKFYNQIRNSKDLSQEQKLRLTKNHIYKIMRTYSNSIVSMAPWVTASPQDPKDLQDQKAAQLHSNVLKYAKKKYRLKEKIRDWADDFCDIGEVFCKVFYDPSLGKIVGYEQKLDEKTGEPMFDEETGEEVQGDPVYSGSWVFERIFGFNLLRCGQAKDLDESPYVHIRKMSRIKDMQLKYKEDPTKSKLFVESVDDTYLVFDSSSAGYSRTKGQCMIVETYYRPCRDYPNGYFAFWTDAGIFEEGELPFGIWPIAHGLFDKFQTSPRGRSHIKVLRPFQAEINRASSKIAEHQITLGDDKIITQTGTKIQQGGVLPGVRGIQVTGAAPQILPGRNGAQYLEYREAEVVGMWRASLVEEEVAETPKQLDPYTLLFQAASKKKKFKLYAERFEQFVVDVMSIFLEQARQYMSDDELIEAIGEHEVANISEFRSPKQMGYLIEVEPMTDDVETKLGQTLTINHALQYVGNKLDKEDIGKLLRTMPYANAEEAFKDMTLQYDYGTNALLALDRGEQPRVSPAYDPKYMIQRLTSRTVEADFTTLPPEAQANYDRMIGQYKEIEADLTAKAIAAKSEFIPTGGALVVVDLYVQDPKNPLSSKRARVPYESIQWLMQRIEQQGTSLGALEQMHKKNMIEIVDMAKARAGAPPMPPQGPQPPPMGQPVGMLPTPTRPMNLG